MERYFGTGHENFANQKKGFVKHSAAGSPGAKPGRA